MNIKKEMIKRALVGLPIGIAIGATTTLIISIIMQSAPANTYYESLRFYINGYIASAIIGIVFGASSVIWDSEKLSLLWQTVLHFVITTTTHLACAIFAGWVPAALNALLVYFVIYVVIYAAVFIIVYSVQKKRVNEVNKALED